MKYLAVLLFFCACDQAVQKEDYTDFILHERDLVPEGIAVDERNHDLYLGSTFKRKILKINRANGDIDFVRSAAAGLWSPVGMEVDELRDQLWVATAHAHEVMPLTDPEPGRDWMSNVSVFDLATGNLIRSYSLQETPGFLNDLTLGPQGEVYVTESVNNKVYRIVATSDSLELILTPEGASFLNGLAYSPRLSQLYIAASEGIFLLDPDKGSYRWLQHAKNLNLQGVDGLTYYKNSLIGHQSNLVSRFYLDESGLTVIRQDTLDDSPELDASTTGEVVGDDYYYIVNSQINSALNGEGGIRPLDSLDKVIIRRMKL